MACFSIPNPIGGTLDLSVPVVSAIINAILAYQEYRVYKEQRDSLNDLTSRNMDMGDAMNALKKLVRAKRVELYEKLNDRPKYEVCCEDALVAKASIIGKVSENMLIAMENMGSHQTGKIESAYRRAVSAVPQANARVAEYLYQERRYRQLLEQNQTRAITTSAHHADMPSPAVYGRLAESYAEQLNDAVFSFNTFFNEATTTAGYIFDRDRGVIPEASSPQSPEPSRTDTFPDYTPISVYED